jgi:hypothetical protein
MEALGPGLNRYHKGITAIEVAYNNGLQLVPNGREVEVIKNKAKASDYKQDGIEAVIAIIRHNREDIIDITRDPQRTRQALSEVQETLSKANTWVVDQLDLWDRLEKVYRALFPDDKTCIMGSDGCLPDAVVRCEACCRAPQ